ncbi:DNA-directed RNA polymerase I subunit 1 [Lolium rigidum]|uniref:DNA-directed RNA polymerase I subunit 1 n=1 Tax=Lolium rigidum TaxID=89674 RepID=UPI001F5C78D2|nr:DNA-directed RNA polymerase I subunit 1 [Lolium rigidum]
MDLEATSVELDSILFGFYTEDEVKRLSVRKLTKPERLDAKGCPVPGGLLDPAMGPLNANDTCKTCAQPPGNCPGHFGHIELAKPLFNPLLFDTLRDLLRSTCFTCRRFRLSSQLVFRYARELELLAKGDVAQAKNLQDSAGLKEEEEDDETAEVTSPSGQEGRTWTSLQLTEALSVFSKLMKKRVNKCANCGAKSPPIKCQIYGWLKIQDKNGSSVRRKAIADYKLEGDGHSHNTSENAVSGLSDDTVKVSRNQTRHISDNEVPLLTTEVESILRDLWEKEPRFCMLLCDFQQNLSVSEKRRGYEMFFLKSLLVPPNRFRPSTVSSLGIMEHPQNVMLGKVQEANLALQHANAQPNHLDILTRWRDLQTSVNLFYDSSKGLVKSGNDGQGIRQLLDKKTGILRQKMMGKRVNHSCRTVISPDPFLAVNEIGIPPAAALKMTYPEKVTHWNTKKLQEAINNGGEIHPGATHVKVNNHMYKLSVDPPKRRAVAKQLPASRGSISHPGKDPKREFESKVVYRHIQDGDIVLVNRQPTLHKPSMMAHVVRVLPGEKTIRMHYANCSTYNADFDGDEMNVHFPQDEISRAEAINIVDANKQYIGPRSGEAVRGLIQDHIVGAVLLTKPDTFLSREEYSQLVYGSCVSSSCSPCQSGKRVSVMNDDDTLELLPPAIFKPKHLWTGKQVITTILNHLTNGHPPFTVKKEGKIPVKYLLPKKRHDEERETRDPELVKKEKEEQEVLVRNQEDEQELYVLDNELIKGMIDKKQFGNYGIVHTVQELYGADTAGRLLSIFSRLFTLFLQFHGFTCGVDDLLLSQDEDQLREKILLESEQRSEDVHWEFAGHGYPVCVKSLDSGLTVEMVEEEFAKIGAIKPGGVQVRNKKFVVEFESRQSFEAIKAKPPSVIAGKKVTLKQKLKRDPADLQMDVEKVVRRMGESGNVTLDKMMLSALNKLTSEVNQSMFPYGLQKPFPKNCLTLMTATGAKGSDVNMTQISSLLGSQDLEGARVPRMVSGKALPCFRPWDTSSRAGGYVSDRFLTGLRPQEYYFHCMAGRNGLIDTAVKTSRSGYLQRCLVKSLESLFVSYDHTVRNVDGSIIQFCYGEDGVDVHKSNFLNKFEELAANRKAVLDRFGSYSGDSLLLQSNYITNLPKTLTDNAKKFVSSQEEEKLRKEEERKLQKEEEGKLSKEEKLQREKFLRLIRKPGRYDIEIEELTKLLNVKYRASLIEPGEAVGVILAQSLGEPSTQMTLNTFHLAGRGDMNVTLGMPRIQEILMKASANISTPYMECPLHENITKGDAERLAAKLRGVRLADVVAGTEVCTVHFHNSNGHVSNLYKLQLKLHSPEDYPDQSELTADECQTALRTVFIDAMEYAIEKHLNLLHKVSGIQETRVQDTDSSLPEGPEEPESRSIDREELVASDGDDENEDDMGADAKKWKQQQNDELEYDDTGNADVMDSDPEEETKYKPDNEDDPAESGGESEVEDEGHMSDSGNRSGKLEDGSAAGKLKKEKSETVENLEQKQAQTTQKRSKKVKRAVHVESTDLKFEVHYLLHKEPTILLAQIAQKTLKSLFVSGSHNRNIGGCKAVWVEKEGDPSPKMLALRTAGVDFEVFWALQDILKIQDVKSNDIHAILKTYGVEAARATIIHEVNAVFQPFGIDVNKRHLSLVADFMTSGGSYRPMSILGMAQFCTSPFGKMSFEQATRFISEAAFYGEVDTLDGPSASVSLGKPAKMGTGCFGLLQNMCFVEPTKM